MTTRPRQDDVLTPDRMVPGRIIDRAVITRICELLGYDPARVLWIEMDPQRVEVRTITPSRETMITRHAIR